jgi:archaellin
MIETLKKVTNVAKIFQVDSFIIEKDIIRGINSERTSAIFTKVDLDISHSIGVNRIDVLLSRITLSDDLTLEIIGDTNEAQKLVFKNDKIEVEYRTGKISTIVAPKSLQVSDLYEISIAKELSKFLTKSKSAMKIDNMGILCNNNQVSHKLNDDNNDKLVYSDGEAISLNDSEPVNFVYNYSIKSLLNAFSKCDEKIIITEKGMIHFIMDGIDVYLLPLK